MTTTTFSYLDETVSVKARFERVLHRYAVPLSLGFIPVVWVAAIAFMVFTLFSAPTTVDGGFRFLVLVVGVIVPLIAGVAAAWAFAVRFQRALDSQEMFVKA